MKMFGDSCVTKMNIQRLRNLTTGRLHTKMEHIYEDLGIITGETNLMTHMVPRAMRACEPWLREHVTEPRFWDGEYDTTHTGELELPASSEVDRAAMFERYAAQPSPLAGKKTIPCAANRLGRRYRRVSRRPLWAGR